MKQFTALGRLRERVRSTLRGTTGGSPSGSNSATGPGSDGRASESDERERNQPDAPGNLFQCSTCGSVYIAAEKRFCPECETEVEQVRSTLACQ